MNVGGTRNAIGLAGKLEAGHFHQVSSVAASGDFRGVFDESMFDEGQRLPSAYHRTKFESEKIVREECRGAVAGLPAGRRGRSLRDRRDGQDRRPLLLLPAVQADARQPARLDAAGRRRPRRHQRGAGRLRRQGDGPHRPPARPRRPGLPPGQPGAAEHRRAGQHLRRGREGAAVRRTRSTGASPPGCPPRCSPAALRPANLLGAALRQPRRCTWRSTRPSAGSASRRRCSSTSRSRRSTPRGPPRRRWPAPGISVPDLDSYASTLWSYWEEMLDDSIKNDSLGGQGADRQDRRDHRRLLGHRPGHRRPGRQGRRRSRSWSPAGRTSSRPPSG